MKVICTSQQENVAQSLSIHKTSLVTTGKFTAPCGWKNSCRQSFVGKTGAKEAIYSYGHRNPQGLAKHPTTGAIWDQEHGPKGGDEINIIKKGANYGWPVTYGIDYDGTTISDKTQKPGIEDPIYYWVPSIAPCGMTFVTSDIPQLKGHLLVGSLKFQYLELVKLDGAKVIGRQKIATDIGRYVMWRKGRTVFYLG
jgi:glucose/arabinose dehydrogenase